MEEGFEDWRISGHLNEVKNQKKGGIFFYYCLTLIFMLLYLYHI